MTPVYLNPSTSSFPLLELKEDPTLQLFISPSSHHEAITSSAPPCATFSSHRSTIQDHVCDGSASAASEIIHQEKVGQYSLCGGTTDRHIFPSSSTQSVERDRGGFESPKLWKNDLGINGDQHHNDKSENGDYGIKWMSSKMRFMQKMKSNSNCAGWNDHKAIKVVHKFTDHHRRDDDNHGSRFNFTSNNNIGNIRVCADCNTTSTPLWRSGPRGPKSLCNACGIRQRKARRAMEEAAAAASGVAATFEGSASSTTTRMNKAHNKDKKPRSGTHVGHYKKHGKAIFDSGHVHGEKKMSFKNLAIGLGDNSAFRQVFSQDVAEAAILLMELSCGLFHS